MILDGPGVEQSSTRRDKTEILARAKELYGKNKEIKNILEEIKTGHSNFKYLAVALIEEVNDLDLARESLLCALEEADGNFYDALKVAEVVAQKRGLNDKVWGATIAKSICDGASSAHDWIGLGKVVAEDLDDKKWGQEIYDRAADTASTFNDFKAIAMNAFFSFKDGYGFVREMILKGVAATEDVDDIVDAANLAADEVFFLGDKELARQIIADAMAKTSDAKDIDCLQSALDKV